MHIISGVFPFHLISSHLISKIHMRKKINPQYEALGHDQMSKQNAHKPRPPLPLTLTPGPRIKLRSFAPLPHTLRPLLCPWSAPDPANLPNAPRSEKLTSSHRPPPPDAASIDERSRGREVSESEMGMLVRCSFVTWLGFCSCISLAGVE
ncbi:uncharacterized protein LY89DRAFT_197085 [Mollisia scopiformis]|uniref:Uncharacterized protein n=1 Tax=Mollisia scopiformis TaxID=149040 RepID=A0A194WY78_MOLSC|nr:uncharacterized protein LY89DRAFT_197085 [Mollisia scopiformis]KUJ12926.1 hypothetical protein LY89DRAFT_197085 [Mollisia scopiformis]